jgi:hypothetical protein
LFIYLRVVNMQNIYDCNYIVFELNKEPCIFYEHLKKKKL